jgi:hypothetical protein
MELIYFFCSIFLSILGLYNIFYCVLDRFNNDFKKIDPVHKKIYVVKNYVKSVFLAIICICIPEILKQAYYVDIDLDFIKRLSIMYFLNDFIALIIVPKLPTNTKLHHIFSSTLGFYTLTKTNNSIDIQLLALMYGCFSCMSFIVNIFLGYRVMYGKTNRSSVGRLSKLSLKIYVITTILNWLVQAYLLYQCIEVTWGYAFYFVFLYMVMKDDIILMKWLRDYSASNNEE